MANKEKEITCTFEFTEGAGQRIADAFAELHYGICDGIYGGPELTEKNKKRPL